jgi:hypothetical protein
MSTRVHIAMSKTRTREELTHFLYRETKGLLPTHLEWSTEMEAVATFASEKDARAVLDLGGGVRIVKKVRYEFTVGYADVSFDASPPHHVLHNDHRLSSHPGRAGFVRATT